MLDKNFTITIESSALESEEFVSWLNENGYDADVGEFGAIDGSSALYREKKDDINALWDKYCNQ